MTKKVLLFAILISSVMLFAQKTQRIGYIDMEYILENIPEYTEAQTKINSKALVWQQTIETQEKEIELLKNDLNNEKVLLTKELIEEKEEDIHIKELELKKIQVDYFGANGDLFFLRQQLVKPIQDLVYNAVQDIASKRKFDFILDKSSALIMLYTNKEYDISELVLNSLLRDKKINEVKGDSVATETKNGTDIVSEKAQEVLDEKEARQEAIKTKNEERKADLLKKREELKKAIEEKRLKRIKEIEEAKKAKEEKKENN